MATTTRRRDQGADALITTARHGRSNDLANREVRYALTMGIRVVCFIGAFFTPGWGRWVLLAGAAFLPGIAVLLANAVDKRGQITPIVQVTEHRTALPAQASPHQGSRIIDHDD